MADPKRLAAELRQLAVTPGVLLVWQDIILRAAAFIDGKAAAPNLRAGNLPVQRSKEQDELKRAKVPLSPQELARSRSVTIEDLKRRGKK